MQKRNIKSWKNTVQIFLEHRCNEKTPRLINKSTKAFSRIKIVSTANHLQFNSFHQPIFY